MSKKWDNINSIIRVNTKKEFRDKVNKRYGKIIVYGDLKENIIAYAGAKNLGMIVDLPLEFIGLFFWPAGIIGGSLFIANMNLFSNYQLEDKSGELAFIHRKYLKKK